MSCYKKIFYTRVGFAYIYVYVKEVEVNRNGIFFSPLPKGSEPILRKI